MIMLWPPNTTGRLKTNSSIWIALANKIKNDDRKSMVVSQLPRGTHREEKVDYGQVITTESIRIKWVLHVDLV